MTRIQKDALLLDPHIIPTFSTPRSHRDQWNDKEWYFSVEGKLHISLYKLI